MHLSKFLMYLRIISRKLYFTTDRDSVVSRISGNFKSPTHTYTRWKTRTKITSYTYTPSYSIRVGRFTMIIIIFLVNISTKCQMVLYNINVTINYFHQLNYLAAVYRYKNNNNEKIIKINTSFRTGRLRARFDI